MLGVVLNIGKLRRLIQWRIDAEGIRGTQINVGNREDHHLSHVEFHHVHTLEEATGERD